MVTEYGYPFVDIVQHGTHIAGDALAPRTVLLELCLDGTLRDALLELALKVLELKVTHLEALSDGAHMRGIALGLLDSRLQCFAGGDEEDALGCLLFVANLQFLG